MSRFLVTVSKNSRERIEVRLSEYQGHEYLDVRLFWRSSDNGEWRPSKKGVTLKPALVGELIGLLEKVKGKA